MNCRYRTNSAFEGDQTAHWQFKQPVSNFYWLSPGPWIHIPWPPAQLWFPVRHAGHEVSRGHLMEYPQLKPECVGTWCYNSPEKNKIQICNDKHCIFFNFHGFLLLLLFVFLPTPKITGITHFMCCFETQGGRRILLGKVPRT